MAERKPKRPKGEPTERGGKISLYGLSIEDALRAAAKTGRPPPGITEAKTTTEETDEEIADLGCRFTSLLGAPRGVPL
jgi:hypothetical protein